MDFEVSVILALSVTILILLVFISMSRLVRSEAEKEQPEAEKDSKRQSKGQSDKWSGPAGTHPKAEHESVLTARREGRKAGLPGPSGGIVLLLLTFVVSSMSYLYSSAAPMLQPVPSTEITIPAIPGTPALDGPSHSETVVFPTPTAAPAITVEPTATPIPGMSMVILASDTTFPDTPILQPPALTPILVTSASSTPIPLTFFSLTFTPPSIPTSTPGPPIQSPSPTVTTAPVAELTIAAAPSASVTTSVIPSMVNVGESAMVMVSLNSVSAPGYTSAEFTCTYDTNLVAATNLVPDDLFGVDPVTAFNGPQNGSFIFAIAGSNGRKAITSGTAFIFSVFGFQAGQAVIECTVRVSKGDGALTSLPSIPTSLAVTGAAPSASPTTTFPAETPTPVASPTAMLSVTPTASTTMTPVPITESPVATPSSTGTPAPVTESPTATRSLTVTPIHVTESPVATPSSTRTPAPVTASPTTTPSSTVTRVPTTQSPVATPSSTRTPAPVTASPTATPSSTVTPVHVTESAVATPSSTTARAPFVQLLSVVPLQAATDCQARIMIQVSGSPAIGQFHVWNSFFGPAGDISPAIVLPLGANNYQVGLRRSRGPYFVWFEYDGTSSNVIDLICPGLIGTAPAPSFTPDLSFIETTSNISLTPTLSPNALLTATSFSTSSTTPNPTLTLQAAFEESDRQFQEGWKANIAFIAPKSMELGDTFNIELLLDPSVSPADLEATLRAQGSVFTVTPESNISVTPPGVNIMTETPEPGELVTSEGEPVDIKSQQVEITNRMKAVLTSRDPDAFTIQSLHNDSEQIVSLVETTKWRWTIVAKKEGTQTLDLVIYQLIKYDDKEFWPQVEAYRSDIVVEVKATQWLKNLDWKWIFGIVVPLLLIPAFWRWIDQRSKQNNSTEVRAGKYTPLKKYLMALPPLQRQITLPFTKIEEILKDGLPDSARQHKSWWANEVKGRHVQASAWLEASWKVKDVDLTSRRVSFMRL